MSGSPPKKAICCFRGEHQAHVGVLLVEVKVVDAALVERDHVAAQAGFLERFLLDLGHDGAAGGERLGRLHVRLDGVVDALGHVLDVHEDVEFQVDALDFLGVVAGVEAVADVVVLLVADLLQRVGADVMVGHHQAVRRDERAGAAGVEAHRRLLHVVEPFGGRLEVVLLLEIFRRRVVEQPHALVAEDGLRQGQDDEASGHAQGRANAGGHEAPPHGVWGD